MKATLPVFVYSLLQFACDSLRKCPLAGIPTGRNTHWREHPRAGIPTGGNTQWREHPRAGIPTGGNTHGRECPPLISLEVGIRGSGFSRCLGWEYPLGVIGQWTHPGRNYLCSLTATQFSNLLQSLVSLIIPTIILNINCLNICIIYIQYQCYFTASSCHVYLCMHNL